MVELKQVKKAEDIILGNTLVYYAEGKPGSAKSAVTKYIADKNELMYIPIMLSTADETDMGLPRPHTMEDGVEVIKTIIPMWAYLANKATTMINPLTKKPYKGSLINFEEMNRCRKEVKDGCLRILNEKEIGYNFKFESTVYMCATGNLGEDDGCDTDEFDSATNNRLYRDLWNLPVQEWVEIFAKENVVKQIVNFLLDNPDHAFKKDNVDAKSFATYRSWTQLSNHIKVTCLRTNTSITEEAILNIVSVYGKGFVGTAITKFITYIQESMKININDIINDFSKVKNELKNCRRDKHSELLRELKEFDLNDFSNKQLTNTIGFLKEIDLDERLGYFADIMMNSDKYFGIDGTKSANFEVVYNEFKQDLIKMRDAREKIESKM